MVYIKFSQKEILEISTLLDGQSGSDIEDIITKAIRNSVIHNSSFSVSNIYEELFITKNIIPQNCNDSREFNYKSRQNIYETKILKFLVYRQSLTS